MQDYVADLTIRLQELNAELRVVQGEVAVVEAGAKPLGAEVEALRERLASLERRAARTLPQVGMGAEAVTTVIAWADAAQAYAAAVDRLRRGDSSGATAQLLALLKRWPDDEVALRAQLTLAQTYAAAGDNIRAIETYLELIESHPQSRFVPEAYLGLGRALKALGQTVQAERVLRDLVRLYPDAPESLEAIRLLQADGIATVTMTTSDPITAANSTMAPATAAAVSAPANAVTVAPAAQTVEVVPRQVAPAAISAPR